MSVPTENYSLKPCPFCGHEADGRGRAYDHDTVWHTRQGQSEPCRIAGMSFTVEEWNRRIFPSESDLKLLNAIYEYFDDTGDGAPDSSSLARQNLNFSEPLHDLIRRLK